MSHKAKPAQGGWSERFELASWFNGQDFHQALGRPIRNKLRTALQDIKQTVWEYAYGDASLRFRIEELPN
ncbi:hypothetical protein GC197_13615 [bacterium]|nr:hypothetical protein [bacterium]